MQNLKEKLHNEFNSPLMEETSSLNPYGPNYYFLAYDTKVYNKFNRLKRYVHLSPEDTDKLIKGNVYYFLGIITSFFIGVGFGLAIKKTVLKKSLNLTEFIEDYPRFYYGLIGSGVTTIGYSFLNDYYIMRICFPMIETYLEKAKENGFEDYDIDETYKNKKISIYIKKYIDYFLDKKK